MTTRKAPCRSRRRRHRVALAALKHRADASCGIPDRSGCRALLPHRREDRRARSGCSSDSGVSDSTVSGCTPIWSHHVIQIRSGQLRAVCREESHRASRWALAASRNVTSRSAAEDAAVIPDLRFERWMDDQHETADRNSGKVEEVVDHPAAVDRRQRLRGGALETSSGAGCRNDRGQVRIRHAGTPLHRSQPWPAAAAVCSRRCRCQAMIASDRRPRAASSAARARATARETAPAFPGRRPSPREAPTADTDSPVCRRALREARQEWRAHRRERPTAYPRCSARTETRYAALSTWLPTGLSDPRTALWLYRSRYDASMSFSERRGSPTRHQAGRSAAGR